MTEQSEDNLFEDLLEDYDAVDEEIEPSGAESEADVDGGANLDYRDVVLAPSDWTVRTVLTQLQESSFELNPDFQRRSAWTPLRQSKFIESLMLGLPIPQLIFAANEAEDGTPGYLVIDGKQRLLALAAFYDEESPLRLTGLSALDALNRKTLPEILGNPEIARYAKQLANRTIRTVVIQRWPDDSFLHLVFHRINHQTLSLSAQELRQALKPGPFTRWADSFAGRSDILHEVLGASQQPDFRMRDVELLVRHLGFRFFTESYRGNLKKFLDDTCDLLNRDWPARSQSIEEAGQDCMLAIEATQEIFGATAFRRYLGADRWENRFNRAVFDVMTYYFAQAEARNSAVSHAEAVVVAFQELSDNPRFSNSLTSSTKTVAATARRLGLWGEKLRDIVPVDASRIPNPTSDSRSLIFGR